NFPACGCAVDSVEIERSPCNSAACKLRPPIRFDHELTGVVWCRLRKPIELCQPSGRASYACRIVRCNQAVVFESCARINGRPIADEGTRRPGSARSCKPSRAPGSCGCQA